MKSFFVKRWSGITTGLSHIWRYALSHKIIAGVVILVLVGGGYWGYTALAAGNAGTQYVLAAATSGPLQVTVTGSGQVKANDTLSLAPKASGEITEINVTAGQTVKAGTIVAEIDMTTAAQAVESARTDLESAQISYKQAVTSSQTGVTNDQTSEGTAQTNTSAALTTSYTNMATITTGLDGILHDFSTIAFYTAEENIDAYANYIGGTEASADRTKTAQAYTAALASYQSTRSEYEASVGTSPSVDQLEQLTKDTIQTEGLVNTAVSDALTYYNYENTQVTAAKKTVPSQLASEITSLTSYQNTLASDISSLTSSENSLVTAEQSLTSDTQSLSPNSSTPLDIQTAQLNLQKAQDALATAEQNEEDYIVRAPFDGTIASVTGNKYDQGSSGTAIATLITTEEYADLSLNETDAAKVQVGQKATVTFDAIPNLTLNGTVAEIDAVGTVTQGVATYDTKISFDTQDSRIKPGMTADATIITASVDNAIQVSSSAIKTVGTQSYIEVATLKNATSTTASTMGGGMPPTGMASSTRRFRTASSTTAAGMGADGTTTPRMFGAGAAGGTGTFTRTLTEPESDVTITRVPVTVGISSNTMTQITSGLRVGQLVVTSTVTASAAKAGASATTPTATSLLGGSATRRTTGGTGSFSGGAGGGFSGGRPGG